MPPIDDKDKEQPSTAVADSTTPAPASSTENPAGAAASSSSEAPAGGTGSKEGEQKPAAPKSALEAVKLVMNADRAAAAAEAKPGEEKPGEQKPGATDDKGAAAAEKQEATGNLRLTDEEFKALPKKAQQRFNELYKAAKTAEGSVTTLTPKAEAFDQLQGWANGAGISQDDFTFGLQVMANIRHNPAKAWEMLQPILKDLRMHVGEELPTDLAAEVEAGTLSKERAQELARTRNEATRVQEESTRRSQADQQNRTTEAATRLKGEIEQSLKGYEDQWKASDPDFALKAEPTWERMMALMALPTIGVPKSREAAVELIKRARKDVEDRLAKVRPAKTAKQEIPAGGANASTRAAPKSALEAAKAALQTA